MVCLHPVELFFRPPVVTKTARLLLLLVRARSKDSRYVTSSDWLFMPAAMGNLGKCGEPQKNGCSVACALFGTAL